MTNEQAIKIRSCFANGVEFKELHTEETNILADELNNAIKRQILKKPIAFKRTAHDFETGICPYSHYECEHIKPYNHEYEYTDYKCPACNKRVSDGTPDYCCHCGQALNWR